MTADILREKFLAFFKTKKHKIIESDSLVPQDDPTVLFTPAGMNQFKKEFLGFDSGFKRAATSQRCLRTDDLDKVGRTSVHHTFFEMLGNFSFGDYFKEEAIAWAWEFLTGELKIDPDKLWVSVYQDDQEAYNAWRDMVKIPEARIVKLGDKDNFWPSEAKTKGPNGPCGPCSEIFYDFGESIGCRKTQCNPACDCGRFAEIWNLVFTQFNRQEDAGLKPLPNKNIDTGMGLERLAAVMQGKRNNFETDLFAPIAAEIKAQVKKSGGTINIAQVNAVADHIRAVVFSVYDGVLVSNESRGYVIRKIIRKSVLALRSMGVEEPFFFRLVLPVAMAMQKPYPELLKKKEEFSAIILAEEEKFINTINEAPEILERTFASYDPAAGATEAAKIKIGKLAFQLHDTYGIPLELTKDWLNKNRIGFSQEAFDQALEGQKTRSKLQSNMKGDVFSAKNMELKVKDTKFLGYKDFAAKAKILKIIQNGREIKKISVKNQAIIVLDQTPFYAESGGQVGDCGRLIKGKNVFEVTDTQKLGRVFIHTGYVLAGGFKVSDLLTAKIDPVRRINIARNHTATHLLQAALRQVLGRHVKQQGSLVREDRLRFDFTHPQPFAPGQLNEVEQLVNEFVMADYPLENQQLGLAQAQKTGALAFFAEKYSGKVRVVSVGGISKEFCGGTHLKATGQIGYFKILQESSISSGVRRIEAITGTFACKLIKAEESKLAQTLIKLSTTSDDLLKTIESKLAYIKTLEKSAQERESSRAENALDEILQKAEVMNGAKIIFTRLDNLNMDLLRRQVDLLKNKAGSCAIALGSGQERKSYLVVGLSADLCAKGLDAGLMVREISGLFGGGGGGRKDFAQAGTTNPVDFDLVFNKLRAVVAGLLS